MIKSALFLFLFCIPFLITAQTDEEEDHSRHLHHHDHRNEIGVANSPVYFVKEKEWSYGLHLHYVRSFHHSPLGIGLGYERIFDEHEHQTIGLVVAYRLGERLSINGSPGVTFEEGNTDELNFAFHLESTYEFVVGDFHLGPVLEFAYDPEDYHISLGVHVGVGF